MQNVSHILMTNEELQLAGNACLLSSLCSIIIHKTDLWHHSESHLPSQLGPHVSALGNNSKHLALLMRL